MSEIRFYIPENETIPTDLRVYVDDVYVDYERIMLQGTAQPILDLSNNED